MLIKPWVAFLGMCVLTAASCAKADTTLVLIRHGEKPSAGLGQLSCTGLNRSLALPAVLMSKFGQPAALYAPNPGIPKRDQGVPYNYIRPLATIEPTAIQLGLPVNTRWGLDELDALQSELQQASHEGQVQVVAWEHSLLVQLARRVMAQNHGDADAVPPWDGQDFDSIYVIKLHAHGAAEFQLDHQGLTRLDANCPGAQP
ncbi:MAG: hypothetical protein JOY60_13370 [Burkholderiaceae bacterium]|nr:hypothetical protein [Roseateles sp.]MBV8470837.1 hypothetical protein [Burkholderiaceae bacterium]